MNQDAASQTESSQAILKSNNQGNPTYRGRFAPSPTGLLHIGSLISAVASYCQARHQRGVWLVRMEDLDQAREQAGAADEILRTLDGFGLYWDESVVYQSQRHPLYEFTLEELRTLRAIYPCACSRKEIQQGLNDDEPLRYPGTCRNGIMGGRRARALRLKTGDEVMTVVDQIQGQFQQQLNREVGDFVLKRADGFYAYQLAVVVDDAQQAINEVVRGADLLDNTPRQCYLQSILGFPQPLYAHVPIAVNSTGEKLSKQTRAMPIQTRDALPLLWQALDFLGQAPPAITDFDHVYDLLTWAVDHWQLSGIPQQLKIPIPQAL